jgi:hypothetical protein
VTYGAINVHTDTEIIPQLVETDMPPFICLGHYEKLILHVHIRIDLLASVLTVRDNMLVIISVVSENRLII